MTDERITPTDLNAERTVLGSILVEPSLYDQAAEMLTPEMFYMDAHRCIFRRMGELVEDEQPIDTVLLCGVLDVHRELDTVGGIEFLSELLNGIPERINIQQYCEKVKSRAMLRNLINLAQNAITEACDNPESGEEVLANLEHGLLQISDGIVQDKPFTTIGDSVREAGGLDSYLHKITDPVAMSGIMTGYADLDRMTGGMKPAEYIIVAARPSMGKSTLVVNIAENILGREPERVIALFSLEMSQRSLEVRTLASSARVNIRRIIRGDYVTKEDERRLGDALLQFADKRLFIDDSSTVTPTKMRAKLRNLKRRQGRLDLVIVDYLQLMASGVKTENRTQEVSAVSRGIKAVCKDLGVPFLAACQLSRSVENRKEQRPMLSDLRESGQIEADADTVIFIHQPWMYDRSDPDINGIAELIVGKQRDGPTDIVKLCFIPEVTRFENLAIGRM